MWRGGPTDHAQKVPVVVALVMLVLGSGLIAVSTQTDHWATAADASHPQIPSTTVLAAPHGDILTYDAPDGQQIGATGHWYGYPLTLPVVNESPSWVDPEWLQVRLPERPNGSTAWVRRSDVDLSSTPYYILIQRGSTHLTLFESGQPIYWFPVGLGKASTPTPLGSFFVAINEGAVQGWGSVVLDLSMHSEAIDDWEGSGDAVGAIHGPFGADDQIGDTGTYVSNGCIRMHDDQLAQLAGIQPGTPVQIVD